MTFQKSHEMPTAAEALPGRATPLHTDEVHYVTGRPLKGPHPEGFETAILGMGCFWGVERIFWQLPGVWVTSVGYSGGITPNPTYEETCTGRTGHAEVVQVVFNPKEIGYGDLPWLRDHPKAKVIAYRFALPDGVKPDFVRNFRSRLAVIWDGKDVLANQSIAQRDGRPSKNEDDD